MEKIKRTTKKLFLMIGALSLLTLAPLGVVTGNADVKAVSPCTVENRFCTNVNSVTTGNGSLTVNLSNGPSVAENASKYKIQPKLNGNVSEECGGGEEYFYCNYYFDYDNSSRYISSDENGNAYIYDWDDDDDEIIYPLYKQSDNQTVAYNNLYQYTNSDNKPLYIKNFPVDDGQIQLLTSNAVYSATVEDEYGVDIKSVHNTKSKSIKIDGLSTGKYKIYVHAQIRFNNGIENTSLPARTRYLGNTAGYFNVTYKEPKPQNTGGKVSISGKVKIGKKVSVKVTKPALTGQKYTYKWYVGNKVVSKKSTYKIAKKYKGKKLYVKVSITKSGAISKSIKSQSVKIKK
jgi:hypothetical protein